ncbi:MAG: hypothetical protein IJ598_06240 [Ruminococcus sp.]|nr:hypothetical protein [Ruminococcus sp.]
MKSVKKGISLFLLAVCLTMLLTACGHVIIPQDASYRIVYTYPGEKPIDEELSHDEGEIIRSIFNGKPLVFDNPATAYREDVSVRINGKCYMLGTDGSSSIKYNNQYFHLTDGEYSQLYEIVSKYGVHFPCLW